VLQTVAALNPVMVQSELRKDVHAKHLLYRKSRTKDLSIFSNATDIYREGDKTNVGGAIEGGGLQRLTSDSVISLCIKTLSLFHTLPKNQEVRILWVSKGYDYY